MRILIISDIHGNAEALEALPRDYDQLWVLGDLVNYGPDPKAVLEFVRDRADLVVCGNHDYAIGFDADPRCSQPYGAMAESMARYTSQQLSDGDKEYLANLPLTETVSVSGSRFFLCHAAPSDPLFCYCPPESDQWLSEFAKVNADVLLAGHTHIPFVRELNGGRIANPGSLGQPKTGSPQACYAIWENDRLILHSVPYDYKKTISKVKAIGLPGNVEHDLAYVLKSGGLLASVQR